MEKGEGLELEYELELEHTSPQPSFLEDEELLMGYLEGEMPTQEQLKACLRQGTLAGDFVPVLTGTAFKNKGVQPLLDAVVDYMPSPLDVEAIKGTSLDGETQMERVSSDDEPFSALASADRAGKRRLRDAPRDVASPRRRVAAAT